MHNLKRTIAFEESVQDNDSILLRQISRLRKEKKVVNNILKTILSATLTSFFNFRSGGSKLPIYLTINTSSTGP